MPRNAQKTQKTERERPAIRAFFYISFILVVFLTFVFFYLAARGAISAVDVSNYTAVTFSFIFSTAVFAYLLSKGKTLKDIVGSLGLSKNKLTGKIAYVGIMLFMLLFLLEIIISLITVLTGVQLPTNAQVFESAAPIAILLFSVFIAPLNEEILFRGYLVPRYGIFMPALLFAILHAGYASITEFTGAFIFGLLAGYVFQKTRSLYPSVIAHILVNGVAVAAFLLASSQL